LEAAGDGDDVASVDGAGGEPSEVEEVVKDQDQAESPQKDVEANANAEGAKV
jgi:hypothetical protein